MFIKGDEMSEIPVGKIPNKFSLLLPDDIVVHYKLAGVVYFKAPYRTQNIGHITALCSRSDIKSTEFVSLQ